MMSIGGHGDVGSDCKTDLSLLHILETAQFSHGIKYTAYKCQTHYIPQNLITVELVLLADTASHLTTDILIEK